VQKGVLVNKCGLRGGGAILPAIQVWISRAALLATVLSLLISGSAWADSRVVVRAFKGPRGAEVRAVVLKELSSRGFEVIPNKEVDSVAKARGLSSDELAGRIALSSELMIRAWIDGRVSHGGDEFSTAISVQGPNGEGLAQLTVTRRQSRQLPKAVRRQFWKTLGPAIDTAPAPAAPSPIASDWLAPAAGPPAVESAPPPASKPAWPAQAEGGFKSPDRDDNQTQADTNQSDEKHELTVVEVALSLNSLSRTLRFQEASALGTPDYELAAAPLFVGSLRLYPGARASAKIAGCFGLDGSYQRAFGLGSETAAGVRYGTTFEGFTGSLVGRIPFAQHEVNLLAGAGLQRFLIERTAAALPPVPSVEYRHIRLGAAGRFGLGSRAKLGLEAHWLVIVGTGQLASAVWFPGARGYGFEGSLYLDVRLFAGLSARVRAAYQRSALEFPQQQNSQRRERGVTDSYLTGGAGLSYSF